MISSYRYVLPYLFAKVVRVVGCESLRKNHNRITVRLLHCLRLVASEKADLFRVFQYLKELLNLTDSELINLLLLLCRDRRPNG